MIKERPKVLLVTPELQYTGAVQSFRRICLTLLNNNYIIEVISYRYGPFYREFQKLGICVKIINLDDRDDSFIEQLITKYNLIIANTVETYKVAKIAQNIVPVVWYIREGQCLPDFIWNDDTKFAICNAKKLYCVSEYAKDFIVGTYNKNVEVLHNYVDDVYETEGSFLNIRKNDKIKFLALGTIEKRKGYDILVDAFVSLPEPIKEKYELHFAGRKWDLAKEFYENIMTKIKNKKNIIYHGEIRDRKEIHALINECHVVVVPSRDESCSLVALEGAMMARPLILTQNIGAKYILDENCGWLIRTGDVDALRKAFIEVLDNITRLPEMGKHGRENYLRTSTYDIYEKNIINMVNDNIIENQFLYRINDDIKLYSFDIFNTLIARKYANPDGIFIEIKNKLHNEKQYENINNALRDNFVDIRKMTEYFMYCKVCHSVKQDININEIYDQIAKDYDISEDEKLKLIDLEIQTEYNSLLPITKNIEIIKYLISNHKRVILVSDMYLGSGTIRKFLCKFDNIFNNIPLYVSCEYRCKKYNGNLFEIVSKIEGGGYSQNWLHMGDDKNGDFKQPKKLGIRTNFFNFSELLPYEKYALDIDNDTDIQLYTGIARYIRTSCNLDAISEFGVSMGGPILLPYVFWLLDRANRARIDRLYFIARDGYVLKKIADEIISRFNYTIETGYIYASRLSCRKPVLEQKQDEIDLIKKYLAQEIKADKKFAFVEFAGTGETQDCIFSLLSAECKKLCYGTFYLYHSRDTEAQTSPKYSMLRLEEKFHTLLELLVRAPHGQALGYEQRGKIEPVLEVNEGNALIDYGYDRYVDGVIMFVKKFLEILSERDYRQFVYKIDIFELYRQYLLSNEIDRNTVEILGRIPFVLEGRTDIVQEYAPVINKELVKAESFNEYDDAQGNRILWSKIRSTEYSEQIFDKSDLRNSLDYAINRYKQAEQYIYDIYNSKTYKLGNVIAYVPRNILKTIKFYRNYGLKPTVLKIIEKLGN